MLVDEAKGASIPKGLQIDRETDGKNNKPPREGKSEEAE